MAKTPTSIRSLGRKVDQLERTVAEDRQATDRGFEKMNKRLDTLNLNGSAAALHKLAENADSLIALARVAGELTAAAKRDADWQTWWRMTKQILLPIRPLGIALWTVALSVAAIVVASRIR